VQNCEWQGSAWQCGQARQGRDTYTTTVKILDDEGNTLAITNQTRNNDAGYGANAFKYEDSVSYTGTGSNQFYWEWEGVDEGSFVNMGGPNLLGAKLTMTYDDTVIEEETIELIEEVIEQFEEWEQSFIEPVPIEEFIPIPIALEEFGIVQLEEEIIFEEIVTTLEEEFEEVEILQAFGGPEIVEEEPEVTEETPTETTALTEEPMEEQPEQSETTTVATVQEEPTSEPSSNEQVAVDVQDIQAQVAVKIKAIDKQLAVTNIIVAETMEKQQVDISSYYKQYTDKRQLYEGNVYEDLRMLDDGEIYQNDNRFAAISLNDPVRDYQEQLQKATLIRIQKEKELQVLRRQYAR
jgi:outer membrane biosynthesis protein TonB